MTLEQLIIDLQEIAKDYPSEDTYIVIGNNILTAGKDLGQIYYQIDATKQTPRHCLILTTLE